ncbi:pentapeptide repeat-containing protein [Aquibium oceanicum]|uniref:Pentapeptide repeat-containing protein n=1 Tax=Aquibium oceanicum TaxID=1670800 RepID=A0A1L3SXT9_9HYPH|nr:hypothetical protein BSQ44_24930 [Aquibium oceanicum]
MAGGSEPISITLTLPFSLYGWSFFGAILFAAALIGIAAWLAHLWATRESWHKALVARMDRLGLARRDADDRPVLHAFTWLLLALVPVVAALVVLAIGAAFSLLLVAIRGGPAVATAEGSGLTSSAAAAGVLVVAILGAPFVIWRAIVAQKTVNVAEQGMITDRINKAVEGLGAEKTVKQVIETPRYRKGDDGGWLRDAEGRLVVDKGPDGADLVDRETVERTRPNLEVRIGAIYALERIAQDSLRDHIQIMEILCAYIRENAPASQAPVLPEPPEFDLGDIDGSMKALETWKEELRQALAIRGADDGPVRPREDIQVALTVIGRRGQRQRARESGGAPAYEEAVGAYPPYPLSEDAAAIEKWREDNAGWRTKLYAWRDVARPYRLDLRGTNLAGADLSKGWFDHANFAESRLEGANLIMAGLNGANLSGAGLNGADLTWAGLNDANLSGAGLNGANLSGAGINGAYLIGAGLNGANLSGAGVDRSTSFTNAKASKATVKDVDLSEVALSREQIVAMFGDASVNLPGGVTPEHPDWPAHWPKEVLEWEEFVARWQAWISQDDAGEGK